MARDALPDQRVQPGHENQPRRGRARARAKHISAEYRVQTQGRDRHVASVVAPRDMSARRIMEHLGIFHRKTSTVDRMQMDPDGIERWRELLPVVVRNDGYGPLYVRSSQVEPKTGAVDTTHVLAQRYDAARG